MTVEYGALDRPRNVKPPAHILRSHHDALRRHLEDRRDKTPGSGLEALADLRERELADGRVKGWEALAELRDRERVEGRR